MQMRPGRGKEPLTALPPLGHLESLKGCQRLARLCWINLSSHRM
jgi:hypothetical protein